MNFRPQSRRLAALQHAPRLLDRERPAIAESVAKPRQFLVSNLPQQPLARDFIDERIRPPIKFRRQHVRSHVRRNQIDRLNIDLQGEYYFYKRFALFASMRNLRDQSEDVEVYGPSTPENAQFRQRTNFGSLWTIGVKGTF